MTGEIAGLLSWPDDRLVAAGFRGLLGIGNRDALRIIEGAIDASAGLGLRTDQAEKAFLEACGSVANPALIGPFLAAVHAQRSGQVEGVFSRAERTVMERLEWSIAWRNIPDRWRDETRLSLRRAMEEVGADALEMIELVFCLLKVARPEDVPVLEKAVESSERLSCYRSEVAELPRE
ncbi:MAG: hypothetical protein HY812_21240 [Planctomycetes bacterium]|nr:hypothetical protein [Planctomycetota bacterium]